MLINAEVTPGVVPSVVGLTCPAVETLVAARVVWLEFAVVCREVVKLGEEVLRIVLVVGTFALVVKAAGLFVEAKGNIWVVTAVVEKQMLVWLGVIKE